MIETVASYTNSVPPVYSEEEMYALLRKQWPLTDEFIEYRQKKYIDSGLIQYRDTKFNDRDIIFTVNFNSRPAFHKYLADNFVVGYREELSSVGIEMISRTQGGSEDVFKPENFSHVIDLKLDMDRMRWDAAKKAEDLSQWYTYSYPGDTRPRYLSTHVDPTIIDYMQDQFQIDFRKNRIGWFCVPAGTVGCFHYDSPRQRNSALNVDMGFDKGSSGLFLFETVPWHPGRVMKVDYPEDQPILINVREFGHMIINETGQHRVILTISLLESYGECMKRVRNGTFLA